MAMDDTPYEEMTDAELEELTEQVVSEHESGAVRMEPREEAERVVGTRRPHRAAPAGAILVVHDDDGSGSALRRVGVPLLDPSDGA